MRLRLFFAAALSAALFLAAPAFADDDFANWLQGFRQEAMAQGITRATLDLAFDGVQPIPRIIELDHRQPETRLSFEDYIDKAVNDQRRAKARERLAENRELLEAVGRRFGVQPRFIVALWGIETDFGHVTGNFPVIAALATLAYDGRRASYFRGELIKALRIVQNDHRDPHTMLGSWAGAMGQSQFMPSSFLTYAVSYRGDAPPDIWSKREDVFASIANYLSHVGWHGDETWGRAVSVKGKLPPGVIGLDVKKRLADWTALGIRRLHGSVLPDRNVVASVIQPDGPEGPTLLVYSNFRAILRWNNSKSFAGAVGYLADSME